MEDLMKLKLDSNRIFLDGMEITNLKSYKVETSVKEESVLTMSLYVDTFSDDNCDIDIERIRHKLQVALQEELDKTGTSINKGALERANQLVVDERKTGALNLADLENRINNDAPKAIADEALKIYSMTKDENVALSALALILNAVQL